MLLNSSWDGKNFTRKKYSLYKKRTGMIVTSPVKSTKDSKWLKNFSSGSKLKLGRNSKFLTTDLDVLRSSKKRKEKFPSPSFELVKTKLKKEKLKYSFADILEGRKAISKILIEQLRTQMSLSLGSSLWRVLKELWVQPSWKWNRRFVGQLQRKEGLERSRLFESRCHPNTFWAGTSTLVRI